MKIQSAGSDLAGTFAAGFSSAGGAAGDWLTGGVAGWAENIRVYSLGPWGMLDATGLWLAGRAYIPVALPSGEAFCAPALRSGQTLLAGLCLGT